MSKKAVFSKPMSVGDSTLMMLLSLNLLLLVFFMLLTSMATYGKRHADEVLAQVRKGYEVSANGARNDKVDVPEIPREVWRNNVTARMQGLVANRIQLRVMPQHGNANKVELTMPLSAMFGTDGRILKPELIGNMRAAAGSESRIVWRLVVTDVASPKVAAMAANLAVVAGRVDIVKGAEESLVIQVVPGLVTPAAMGLQVQTVGEGAGAAVKGVDERSGAGE